MLTRILITALIPLTLTACIDEKSLKRGSRSSTQDPEFGMVGKSPWVGRSFDDLVDKKGYPMTSMVAPGGTAHVYASASGTCYDTFLTDDDNRIIGYYCQ